MTEYALWQSVGLLTDVLKRSPIAFLLGAGAPASVLRDGKPAIPTISGLTQIVVDKLQQSDARTFAALERRVNAKYGPTPNIEQYLTYIRTLVSVLVDGDIADLTCDQLNRFDQLACREILNLTKLPLPNDTSYHKLAAWAQVATSQLAVEFFTTNYDLFLESAFETVRLPFFDGFVGSNRAFFDLAAIENDNFPARWAKLWKLHGSINWRFTQSGAIRSATNEDEASNLLIFPSHLKYDESRRLPYVAMSDRLLAFLRNDNAALVSCGFSFGDEHLTDLIASGLRANPTASLFALMFGEANESPELRRFANLTPSVSAYFTDVGVIGGTEGEWNASGISRDTPTWSLIKWDGDRPLFSGGDFAVFSEFLAHMINYTRFTNFEHSSAPSEEDVLKGADFC